MDLQPIERTDRARNRLKAALAIYRETILPEAQNPESQILYWIDHSRDALVDEFRCFALEKAGEVTGYLQFSYFQEEHVFFFEYLCISHRRRTGLVPSDAVEGIESYLAQEYRPGFTITFEVARKPGPNGDWVSDTRLIKYFKRLGFRLVDFRYRYPVLQSYNGAASYPADLMIMLPEQRTAVTACELRTILRCIYFKHYLRWDRPFLPPQPFAVRERLINELYSQQVANINPDDTFGTTGDDRRSARRRFVDRLPRIGDVVSKFFAPKMLRLTAIIVVLLVANWCLNRMGSGLLFIPFILAAALLYCLAENTKETRKLFVVIISRIRFGRQRLL
ncbi:MAG: hypothetical protein QOJ64_2548 [Acidobacteriota bacterium]|jgi:hypothetical protein|nr:hypothetical protein [Acidobacteriota bacterium]